MGSNDHDYSARYDYQDYSAALEYENFRFSGFLGKYRWMREQVAIKKILEKLSENITICDIPCGNGRFWRIISTRASRIIAIDISDGMIKYASNRAASNNLNIEILKSDAEMIPLSDNSVDYVFSFALTKHLPIPIQFKVLKEYSRISKMGVICSFGIFTHLTYEFWRRRHLIESYPVFIEELQWMAESSHLQFVEKIKCTTLFGVEHIVRFNKL